MLHFARWQIYTILGVCLLGIFFALPNVLPESVRNAVPAFIPHQPVPLGLDLRGGAYLLLEADLAVAVKDRTTAVRDDVRKALRSSKILFNGLALAQTNDAVTVRIVDPTKTAEAKSILHRVIQPSGL